MQRFLVMIWLFAGKWDPFKRDTTGKQLVRCADSISANIASDYGKYFYKESKQFYFYARGSMQETKSWFSKCKRRNIIESNKCEELLVTAEKLLARLNAYIKFVAKSQGVSKSAVSSKRIND